MTAPCDEVILAGLERNIYLISILLKGLEAFPMLPDKSAVTVESPNCHAIHFRWEGIGIFHVIVIPELQVMVRGAWFEVVIHLLVAGREECGACEWHGECNFAIYTAYVHFF